MPQRLSGFDQVKGAAIVLVVIGHAWRGLYTAGMIPDMGLYQRIDAAIYLFHMPVFFFLSGLFFSARLPLSGFVQNRSILLIWPMLLWGWVDAALKTAANIPIKGQILTWSEVAWSVLPPVGIFWFLYTLFILHLIGWAILRLPRPAQIPALIALPFAALTGWINVSPFDSLWPAVIYAPPFFAGLAFALLARSDALLTPALFWPGLAAFGLAQTLMLGGFTALHPLANATATALATAGFIVVLANAPKTGWISAALIALGRVTMPIYLSHVIFSAGTRIVLRSLGTENVALHLTLGTIAGIIGPIALIWAARRIGITVWIGFDPPPPTSV
jgi:fucose 4-O-acetylase-like acetyltransferase